MTIRFYHYAPELDGTGNGKLKAGRFEATLVALDKSCGKKRWARSQFQVVGTTDAAVESFAVYIAEQMSKMSYGKLAKLTKILGHYRNDEMPDVVPSNLRLAGSVIASNGCDPDAPKIMSQKVFLPWPKDTISRADLRGLVTQISDGLGIAGLGKVGWVDDQKTELAAYYTSEAVGAMIKDYEKLSNFSLVSNDAGAGVDASDPVLGVAA